MYTISEYVFDDNNEFYQASLVTIDEKIARKILNDFEKKGIDKETLLVHCSLGKNRSSAVAIALNEIYNLGNDTRRLKKRFSEFNEYVYNMLIKVSKEN